MPRKKVLHLGSGPNGREQVHPIFRSEDWAHVRVDLDPKVEPDVVDDIVALKRFEKHDVDGIYSAHSFEHLQFHDALRALVRWFDLLRPQGLLVVVVPDMKPAAKMIAEGRGMVPIYISPAGPITPLDMFYGYHGMTNGNELMCHRWGYTKELLERLLIETGFASVNVIEDSAVFEIAGFARKA